LLLPTKLKRTPTTPRTIRTPNLSHVGVLMVLGVFGVLLFRDQVKLAHKLKHHKCCEQAKQRFPSPETVFSFHAQFVPARPYHQDRKQPEKQGTAEDAGIIKRHQEHVWIVQRKDQGWDKDQQAQPKPVVWSVF